VLVPISFTTDTNVPSFQFDLVFSTNYLTTGTVVPGPANPGYFIFTNATVAPGVLRVLSVGFLSPLADGVVALVPFTIATNAPDHDETLQVSNVVVSSFAGDNVPASGSNGLLAVAVPPRFTSIALTNRGAIHLEITGSTGRTYVVEAAAGVAGPPWLAVHTNLVSQGTLVFDDLSATNFPARFYRARVVP